ncbi:MAG TPA: hypothetical protein VFV36_08140 [Candidatus Methylomirabilis sp.]|nr:hypothetical protein [Candidatus Methylomirabilis sp.]
MRRFRTFPIEDLLLAQAVPGFLLAIGWTVMYEIYNEDGSYYTTLLQEIMGSEDLLPYFLVTAVLMALPVGVVVDTVRHVLGEVWLGLPRLRRGSRAPSSPLHWIENLATFPEDFEKRYALYRHAWVTLLTPAKTAGNLALILLVLTIWFVVKIIRMRGWLVFSLAFIIGTPLVGLALVLALLAGYAAGVGEFHRRVQESIFPPKGTPVPFPGEEAPARTT